MLHRQTDTTPILIISRVCIATYFHPLKVDWIHNGALKEFHSGKVSLEQAFELQVGRFPVMNAQLTRWPWLPDSPPPGVALPCNSMYQNTQSCGGAGSRRRYPRATSQHREKQ